MPGERKLRLRKRKGITMLHILLQSKVLLSLMTATGLLGILCQIISNRCCRQLIREAADTQPEKGEFIKRMRYRYQIDSRCCQGNVNIPVFVQRMLLDYRYRKLTLHQWRRQAAGWYLGSMAVAVLGCRYYQTQHNQADLMLMIRTAAAVTVITVLAVLWCDSRYKERRLTVQMQDYLCHSGISADISSTSLDGWKEEEVQAVMPAETEKKKNSKGDSRAERDKRQLQESLARMKSGERETAAGLEKDWSRERNREILKQMDAKEQERIIREVLTEFLA